MAGAAAAPPADAAIAGIAAAGVLISTLGCCGASPRATGCASRSSVGAVAGDGATGQLGSGLVSCAGACGNESPSEASKSATNSVSSLVSACTTSATAGWTCIGSSPGAGSTEASSWTSSCGSEWYPVNCSDEPATSDSWSVCTSTSKSAGWAVPISAALISSVLISSALISAISGSGSAGG